MSWMLFPDNSALSALVLALIALPFLYAMRSPVHSVILELTRAVANSLRLGARWLARSAEGVRSRNRTVLLAHGREEVKLEIEREFQRVSVQVKRDLNGYPALQRNVQEEITRIEEDFKKCGEVPPPPPEWIKAVEAIAKVKNNGDGLAQKLLEDIAKSIERIYDKVVDEYRRAYEVRHGILKGFMPFWRSLDQTLVRVDRNITGLQSSATRLDALMDKYQQIEASAEKVEHSLTASASTQFAVASVVLAIACGGAFVNFYLIARPMAAMVGGGEYIAGGIEASHIAAMVIILLETTAGLFLMEALRMTHLFPRVQSMPDKRRHLILGAALFFLVVLGGFEVALAVMRDHIITADIALKQGLSGVAVVENVNLGWAANIPVAGQMILGFVLPFLLAFVAIPFEYFISSARTVLGAGLVLALRGSGLMLRISGNVIRHIGAALVMMYDAIIFVPVLIERAIKSGHVGGTRPGGAGPHAGSAAMRRT